MEGFQNVLANLPSDPLICFSLSALRENAVRMSSSGGDGDGDDVHGGDGAHASVPQAQNLQEKHLFQAVGPSPHWGGPWGAKGLPWAWHGHAYCGCTAEAAAVVAAAEGGCTSSQGDGHAAYPDYQCTHSPPWTYCGSGGT